MSDFLRNLRSSHKKESSNPRRHIDGNYFPSKERRKISDRRTANHSAGLEMLWSNLNDFLPALMEITTELKDSLQHQHEQNAELITARIRQHNAISEFFETINKLFDEGTAAFPPSERPKATASYTSGTHYTKDDILTMIRTMRKDGATFSVIADYLKEKGIPTFSGRGEWHAQTIHRLCK